LLEPINNTANVSSSRWAHAGMGICRSIIEAHGAWLWSTA
jgi:hypothetical protein